MYALYPLSRSNQVCLSAPVDNAWYLPSVCVLVCYDASFVGFRLKSVGDLTW